MLPREANQPVVSQVSLIMFTWNMTIETSPTKCSLIAETLDRE